MSYGGMVAIMCNYITTIEFRTSQCFVSYELNLILRLRLYRINQSFEKEEKEKEKKRKVYLNE